LKDRLGLLQGRCAACRFKNLCGGSLRARAEISTGEPWAPDPGCYLSDEEIASGGCEQPATEVAAAV
jgi:MoaA/NifB/PqqE/SkfB family radical SAM enzyme